MNLTALQHSPFLQSLGWAIANSLWQAAALWIAYLLVSGIYKGTSAKFKNNLSTILLSSSFIWFLITLFTKYFAIEDVPVIYQVEYYQVNNSANTYNWNDVLNKIAAVLPYLSIAYLLLLVLLSVRLINIYRFTNFIKLHGLQKPSAEWKLFTERVSRHMGITRKIKLWVSHNIDVPATIGFIKPVILIPLASVNQLSADQLEAIILHELSHIKRNDYLINLFISIVETILFFNPFVVLLAKIIKRERENCCDDFVIQYQYDRHAYASALLSLEQFRNVNLRLAIGATSGKKQLLLRVKRIMEINSNTNFNYGQKLAALFLITGIICSVAWLSPQNKENKKQLAVKKQEKVSDKKIIDDPKFETVFATPTENKIKIIPIKIPIKKDLVKTEQQLKELKDLNLKQIADRESNRLNMLSLESKAAILNKRIEKLNRNKFFIARTAPSPALFFDNGIFMLSTKPAVAFAELNPQQVYAADMQKLQAEWDKAQFSFSFNCDNMQDVLREFNKGALNQKQIIELQQNIKNTTFEKLIKIGATKSAERILRSAHVNTPRASGGTNASEAKAMSRSRQNQESVSGGNATTTWQDIVARNGDAYAYTYSYGGGGNKIVVDDESQPKRRTTKVFSRSNENEVMPAPVIIPDVPEYRSRTAPTRENNPSKMYLPKQTVPRAGNIRVEYRNGVVYINGKEIELPETNEILAQVSLKAKKILSKVKNINVETGD